MSSSKCATMDSMGHWRGACECTDCRCGKYMKRPDPKDIKCSNCGHLPKLHRMVELPPLCNDRQDDGSACDCIDLIVAQYGVCYNCGHEVTRHQEAANMTAQSQPLPSPIGNHSSDESSDDSKPKAAWRNCVSAAKQSKSRAPDMERSKDAKRVKVPKGSAEVKRSSGLFPQKVVEKQPWEKTINVQAVRFRKQSGLITKLGTPAEAMLRSTSTLLTAKMSFRIAMDSKFTTPLSASLKERFYNQLSGTLLKEEHLPKLKTVYFFHPTFAKFNADHVRKFTLGELLDVDDIDGSSTDEDEVLKPEVEWKLKKSKRGLDIPSDDDIQVIEDDAISSGHGSIENEFRKRKPMRDREYRSPDDNGGRAADSVNVESAPVGQSTPVSFERPADPVVRSAAHGRGVLNFPSIPKDAGLGSRLQTLRDAPRSAGISSGMFALRSRYGGTSTDDGIGDDEGSTSSASEANNLHDETVPYFGFPQSAPASKLTQGIVIGSGIASYNRGQTFVPAAVGTPVAAVDLSKRAVGLRISGGSISSSGAGHSGSSDQDLAVFDDPEIIIGDPGIKANLNNTGDLERLKKHFAETARVSMQLFELGMEYVKANHDQFEIHLQDNEDDSTAIYHCTLDFFLQSIDNKTGRFKDRAVLFELFSIYCKLPTKRFYVLLDRSSGKEYLKQQIMENVKNCTARSPADLRQKALVSFEGEKGTGAGLVDVYTTMIEEHLLNEYFEGKPDHQIPIKAFDGWTGEFIGQLMGHVMCQNRIVKCGLSNACKLAILGHWEFKNIPVTIEDVPYGGIHDALMKLVQDGVNALDDGEMELISNALTEQEVGSTKTNVRLVNNVYRLPRPGQELEVVELYLKTVVLGSRKAQYDSIAEGIQSVCDLRGFVAAGLLFEKGRPIGINPCMDLVDYFFATYSKVKITKADFKKALVISCQRDVDGGDQLQVVGSDAMKSLIDSLPDDAEAESNQVTVTKLWDWLTGRPYRCQEDVLTINVTTRVKAPGFAVHVCTKTLDISPFHLADENCVQTFKDMLLGAVTADNGHFGIP